MRIKYLALTAWFFLVSGYVAHIFFQEVHFEQIKDRVTFPTSPPVLRHRNLRSSFPDGPATFEYLNRNGTNKIGTRWTDRILIQSLNKGVHTASKASPAVDESGVYVGSDDGWFYALDPNGNTKWRFRTGNNYMGFHGTALLTKEHVFVGAYNGRFYCLKKENGEVQWQIHLADAVGSSPILVGNYLFISAEQSFPRDGFLYKIDYRNGRIEWRSGAFHEQVHSSPTISTDHKVVFVGENAGNLRAFDASTGELLWFNSQEKPIKSTPRYEDGVVYVTNWSSEFKAIDSLTGKDRWKISLNSTSQSTPLLVESMAIFSSRRPGTIYGVSLKNRAVKWKIENGLGELGMSSFVEARLGDTKKVALGQCKLQSLCIVEPSSGKIIKEHRLPGVLTSVPAVLNGTIYLSLDKGPLLAIKTI